jgi:hypothetical protein
VRYLREKGREARGLRTLFEGERDDAGEEVASEAVSGEPEAPAPAGEGTA